MDTTLAATERPPGKKGEARKLRATGMIPAVMYGPDIPAQHLAVDPIALDRMFNKSGNRNTVVQIDVGGKVQPTLVRDVQRHPVTRALLHADFYALNLKRKVEVMVPLEGTGRPAGAINGGRLRLIRRTVKIRCTFDQIPEKLSVDITPMHVGDMVKASEIPLPTGVEMVFDNDYNVLTVYGKRVAKPGPGDKKV